MRLVVLALAMLGTILSPSVAQESHAGHGAGAAAEAAKLPAICMTTGAADAAPAMAMGHEMDEAHSALMAGMAETNRQMMEAMMVEDIDVAFVCGMIPHHHAAITMAQAELAHGDNPWAKAMAQKIIDAQQAEIAEMLAWLEGEGAAE